jgi:uroporphyrinogen-III synthase
MRVLILRPEPQASVMAADLGALGFDTVIESMLMIDYHPDVVTSVLSGGETPTALLVTSVHGVAALKHDPRLPDLFAVPVVTVGPATATAARSAGFIAVIEAAGDGAALVDLVATRFSSEGGRLVHVAGRDRAGDVAGDLKARGFTVTIVEAYRAEITETLSPHTAAAIASDSFDAAIVGSARTAEAFRRSVEATGLTRPLARPVIVAISAGAAAPLAGLFDRIVTAEEPHGESLRQALVALRSAGADNADPDAVPPPA